MTIFDPLDQRSPGETDLLKSLWYCAPAHKLARDTRAWEPAGKLAQVLAQGTWEDAPVDGHKLSKEQGKSILAWRGLWTDPARSLPLIAAAFQAGLAPPPTQLDWFGAAYFREKALQSIFSPPYNGAGRALTAQQIALEPVRRSVADHLVAHYPALLHWFMASKAKASAFFHPLTILARPGSEPDLQRALTWRGWEPLFEEPEQRPGAEHVPGPRFTPETLLALGIERGFAPLVEEALRRGAKLSDTVLDRKGHPESLLHIAIAKRQPEMIDRILASGAHLELLDRWGRTPFLAAAYAGDVPTLEKLQAAGANIHVTDRFGQTALHLAVAGARDAKFAGRESRSFAAIYEPLARYEVEANLLRAAQALNALEAMGLEGEAPLRAPTAQEKKARFAGLPARIRAAPGSAKEGETWRDQLERRVQESVSMNPWGAAWFLQVKLTQALTLPWQPAAPEDEEEPAPVPTPRRPRF